MATAIAEVQKKRTRISSPILDAMIGDTIPVLDNGTGWIEVVDYMGDDSSVADAARLSYGVGTKQVSSDRRLLRRLMRDEHTSPFEQCEISIAIMCPISVMRQWVRHRTAHINEYSLRYSEAIDVMHTVSPIEWRMQSKNNRQGSQTGHLKFPAGYRVRPKVDEHGLFEVVSPGGMVSPAFDHEPTPGEFLTYLQKNAQANDLKFYKTQLDFDIAREQARDALPLAQYTKVVWKIDLHNLLHFLRLRVDPHAQQEIRSFANAIARIVKLWVPICWEAFEDYRLNAISFSGPETIIIGHLMNGQVHTAVQIALEYWPTINNGECNDFYAKLNRMKVPADSFRRQVEVNQEKPVRYRPGDSTPVGVLQSRNGKVIAGPAGELAKSIETGAVKPDPTKDPSGSVSPAQPPLATSIAKPVMENRAKLPPIAKALEPTAETPAETEATVEKTGPSGATESRKARRKAAQAAQRQELLDAARKTIVPVESAEPTPDVTATAPVETEKSADVDDASDSGDPQILKMEKPVESDQPGRLNGLFRGRRARREAKRAAREAKQG